ncbi:MAG: hypothetical protein ACLRQF_22060 [Thomasclavelia ramosa]
MFNTKINLKVIDFLEVGYLDFLVIPQDDSSLMDILQYPKIVIKLL